MVKRQYIARRHRNVTLPPLSKTDEMSRRYDDVIDLSVGDPDMACDREIIEQMYADALAGHTKYTEFQGDGELRTAICRAYQEDYNCLFDKDNIMITSGGTHAMFLLMESVLDEGDEVIVIAPFYTYYEPQIQLGRGKMVIYPTDKDNDFELNVTDLEQLITPKTKAVIVNTPNNPTGRVYHESSIKQLIALADQHDFLIIADDIYSALNFTDRTTPIHCYDSTNPRIITIYSFSKDFLMTGFRLGYVVADREIIKTLRNVNEAVNFTVNAMAQRAGIYALQKRHAIWSELAVEYKKRADYAYHRIKQMKNMDTYKPEGTFYLFVDIRQTGLTSEEVWEMMLDQAHVLVQPGSGFGVAGEGYLRIALTCDVEVLTEAFDRIEQMDVFR